MFDDIIAIAPLLNRRKLGARRIIVDIWNYGAKPREGVLQSLHLILGERVKHLYR